MSSATRHFHFALLFFILFIMTSCRDEKQTAVEAIVKYNLYTGPHEGLSTEISPQWKSYEILRDKCTEQELVDLSNHLHPIVRCYAFDALAERCSPRAYEVLLQHLSDTASFEAVYGCMSDIDNVTDNLLYEVGYDGSKPTHYSLTNEQYNFLDSVLLFRDEIKEKSSFGSLKHFTRRYSLERLKPRPVFYDRIKELAKSGVHEALPLLAKYQNPADTSIFKKILMDDEFSDNGRIQIIYVRKAISFFPHPAFFPVLSKLLMDEVGTNGISDDLESFPLYLALAHYPTKETRALFQRALEISGDEYEQRAGFIYKALKRYPSKVLDGVVKKGDFRDLGE